VTAAWRITTVGDAAFTNVSLPIGQMYHVAVDDQIPTTFMGTCRTLDRCAGPACLTENADPMRDGITAWAECESGFTAARSRQTQNIVWGLGPYADEVTRWDAKTKRGARSVSPYLHTLVQRPNQVKYRCHWTHRWPSIPSTTNTVYYGCQVVFQTSDGGISASVTSPSHRRRIRRTLFRRGGLIGRQSRQFLW